MKDIKTRTNQPVEYKFDSTANIENLSDAFINGLQAGDIVVKETGNLRHTYIVSYKEDGQGICLTYTACGYIETISYDLVDGHWVFNSKDVCEVPTDEHIVDTVNQGISDGDITVGTKLYKHLIDITCENDDSFEFYIINSSNEEITECEMSIGMDYLSASVDLNNEEWNDMPVYIRFAVETTLVIQCGGTDFESISNVSSITDEISPL